MVSKAEVLAEEWFLLRSEITGQNDIEQANTLDGYSRFWCKHAVLGAHWVAERVEDATVRLHLAEDVEPFAALCISAEFADHLTSSRLNLAVDEAAVPVRPRAGDVGNAFDQEVAAEVGLITG